MPRQPAPEVPASGFDRGRAACVMPPEDGRAIELAIDPDSERLQRLEPWPAWDGEDFLDMPVLLKTKGKTTTDHISPAGPYSAIAATWTGSSDNMFMGADQCVHRRGGYRAQRHERGGRSGCSRLQPGITGRAGEVAGGRRRELRRRRQLPLSMPRCHPDCWAAWR